MLSRLKSVDAAGTARVGFVSSSLHLTVLIASALFRRLSVLDAFIMDIYQKGRVILQKLGRNEFCWCGSGKKYKVCHSDFDSKLESYMRKGAVVPPRNIIKNQEQIQGIRESGKINVAILDYVSRNIQAGITTEQINQWVHEQTLRYNAIPAPLNTKDFQKMFVRR